MNAFLLRIFGLIFRAALLGLGLVFFASILVMALALLALWLARAAWARITGQPAKPWVFQINPKAHWSRFNRAPPWGQGTRYPADSGEVIDVQAKDVQKPDRRLKG